MYDVKESKTDSWILYLGTYPPRECGIATFTKDLTAAIDNKSTIDVKKKICAINKESFEISDYPDEVILQINDSDIQDYIETAKKINQIDEIKVVSIQHEFGIFGGEFGSYLIPFLEIIKKPVFITLHSLLPNPPERMKRIVQLLSQKSVSLVVMTEKAFDILKDDYQIDSNVVMIPHGIPSIPFNHIIEEKKKLGLENHFVLTSFGLISSGKGYEHVIDSLPEVVKIYPNVLYIILGETHPVVRKQEGEIYREFLEEKVEHLGLQDNVKFYNKYLDLNEILQYIGATDIYISAGLDCNQITSGTLSYAMGCGRAVISTPFLHAKDIVNNERGLLVEFKNPKSFTDAIIKILSDDNLRNSMIRNSYAYTRKMTWPNVALSYLDLFEKNINMSWRYNLPKINLNHLKYMTDDFGIIQFANYEVPDLMSGYTLDDNARAMIVCSMFYNKHDDKNQLKLIRTYLNFMEYVQQENGEMFNFVDHKRNINDEHWSDDAFGRAIWALGYFLSLPTIPSELRNTAEKIFNKTLDRVIEVKSPRAVAFIIIGLYFKNRTEVLSERSDKILHIIRKLADHLVSIYKDTVSDDWSWFEEYLAYSNSKLSEALFYAGLATGEKKYNEIARDTLNFLNSITFEKGYFNPVGQNGWYVKNKKRAYFDQQPLDAASMVQTLTLAYGLTKDESYKRKAITVFEWFLGKNFLKQTIYDELTGGCHDGLGQFSINLNKGAESTASYLMARLTIEDVINI